MFGNSVSRPFPSQISDVTGRLKTSYHQNIYEADFEYGAQPLRWESFTAPAGGSGLQQLDLSQLFPLYTNIKGNVPDILTLAITTTGTASDVGAHFICQEAMS